MKAPLPRSRYSGATDYQTQLCCFDFCLSGSVLEESLLEFRGALVLVTHDRYLPDRVSTTLLGFDWLSFSLRDFASTPLASFSL